MKILALGLYLMSAGILGSSCAKPPSYTKQSSQAEDLQVAEPAPPEHVLGEPPPPKAEDVVAINIQAQALEILNKNCAVCHTSGNAQGNFGTIANVEDMIASGRYIVPGSPEKSVLITKLAPTGNMPPGGTLKKEEVDILTAWVKEIKLVPVVPLSESDAINLVRKDLETNVAAGQRSGVRYFSLHVPQNLGATAATLGLLSQAFFKVINSISRAPMIIEPKAIDKNRLLYRIQLSDLAMNEAAFEKVITNYYPFGKDFTAGKNIAGNRRTAEDHQYLKTELGTEKYLLRADWFIATATLPQLYSEFLQLGADQLALQTQLGVNQIQNILDNKVVRSGFKNSNVSSQNRVIERHLQTSGLAYWLSYDFISNEGKANIFSSPLGPIGIGNDARSFAHDGGEMIFQLPNGMLAYYLANAAGVKIDKGPTSIVRQADAPVQFSTAILNGVSCMNCHGAGLLHKVDEVRNFSATLTDALTADEMTKVRNLFVEEKTFKGLLDKDNAIHFKALSVLGINPALPDPVNQGYRYYNRSLSRADVREELGFSEAEFAKLMTAEPFRTQWSSLNGSQGYIKRDELQGFLQQALELHTDLALPINPLIGDAVITPQCMFANPLQTNGCLVRIPPPPPAPDAAAPVAALTLAK